MKLETLKKLYLTQLRDIYDSENQILEALPSMASAATHPQLKKAFEKHQVETEQQVQRLAVILLLFAYMYIAVNYSILEIKNDLGI